MSENERGGLGRGLSALLPTAAGHDTPASSNFQQIPLDSIAANPMQPRSRFDHDALNELATSIRAVGVLQPVVVRRAGTGYQLVMGERRVRAARLAGLTEIPAVVRDIADASMLRDALIENIQRQDLNPIEEAVALRALIDEHAITHDMLGDRIGKSRASVSNSLRLLSLSASVQGRVASGVISAAHGRAIAALSDPAVQERVAMRVSAESLSVRATEEMVRKLALAGDARVTERAAQSRKPRSAGILEVEHRLTDMLDTRVRVEGGRRGRGRIVVEFADQQDLDRIFHAIADAKDARQ